MSDNRVREIMIFLSRAVELFFGYFVPVRLLRLRRFTVETLGKIPVRS